jgi:hypothetical protein
MRRPQQAGGSKETREEGEGRQRRHRVPMALMQVRNPNRGSTEPAEEEMVTMPSKFVASPAPENILKSHTGRKSVCV